MSSTFVYYPENVCSREMQIVYEGGTIVSLKVIGGCNGNLQGIGRLVAGQKIDDVISKLQGIPCRGSRTGLTSCPDQLSLALQELKAKEGI